MSKLPNNNKHLWTSHTKPASGVKCVCNVCGEVFIISSHQDTIALPERGCLPAPWSQRDTIAMQALTCLDGMSMTAIEIATEAYEIADAIMYVRGD